jgi:hypothetical protein
LKRKVGYYGELRAATIYVKEGTSVRLSLHIYGNKPLKIGLLKHFMKVADIDESEL